MKDNVTILVKLQLMSVLNPAFVTGNRDKKKRQRVILTMAGAAAVSLILMVYSAMMAHGYLIIGYGSVIPMLMFAVCSLLIIAFTLFRGSGTLFGSKDFGLMMSLPVKTWQIVLAKSASLYLVGLYGFAVFFVPAMVMYMIFLPAGAGTFVWILVLTLFGPIFPTVLALTLGTVVAALTSRIPHRQFFSILLYLAVLVGVFVWTGRISVQGEEALADFGVAVSEMVGRIYPPALWADGPLRGNLTEGAWLLVFSAGTAGIFVSVVSRYYLKLNSLLASLKRTQRRSAAFGKRTTVFAALFRKERKRLTSCTIYALNTTVGCLLMILAGVAILFADEKSMEAALGMPGFSDHIQSLIPWILGLLAAMAPTTAPSLSLEGKNRWIMCSLPVTPVQVFGAKIAVNLAVSLPCVLLSGICFWIKFRPGLLETLLLFGIPSLCSLFAAVLGMYSNVKFPVYDWTHEQQAVKNSMSVLAAMLGGMAQGLIPLLLIMRFPSLSAPITLAGAAAAVTVTGVCWQKLKRTRLFV